MQETSSTSGSKDLGKVGDGDAISNRASLAIIVLAFSLVCADFAAGFLLDKAFKKSSSNPVAAYLQSGRGTIILGASGAKYSLDPRVLGSNTYNAAQNGQTAYYVPVMLNALPPGSADTIIYAFDPSEVHTGLKGSNVKHLARFAPYASKNVRLRQWLSLGKPLENLKLMSGFYRYRGISGGVVKGWLKPHWHPTGFDPLNGVMKQDDDGSKSDPAPPLEASVEGLEMLDAIATVVARQGSQLIVVVTPAYQSDRAVLKRNHELMRAMRNAFSGLRFCDLTETGDPRLKKIFETSAFYTDGAHMNGAGAKAYSSIVQDLIASRCAV